jgi:hypothetical protein
MKNRLMGLLAFYLCLLESAYAQWHLPNSSLTFLSHADGRKFAITLAAILAGTFVVLSVLARLTQRRAIRQLPRKEHRNTRQPSANKQPAAQQTKQTCQTCGAKLTKAPTGDWFCLNC